MKRPRLDNKPLLLVVWLFVGVPTIVTSCATPKEAATPEIKEKKWPPRQKPIYQYYPYV